MSPFQEQLALAAVYVQMSLNNNMELTHLPLPDYSSAPGETVHL